jgi:hypothetical protein
MNLRRLMVLLGLVVLGSREAIRADNKTEKWDQTALLWRDPGNIAARDLFYGAGGRNRQPRGKFTFVEEDREGFNPKFVVRDQAGSEWKVKLGPEARAETAATRLIWAVGYFTDEDYLVPVLRVANMPRLSRGQKHVSPDGSMRNARMERRPGDAAKVGYWKWRRVPTTRELNGLKILIALVNNWDLKDTNNSIYEMPNTDRPIYLVSDVGAVFGGTGFQVRAKKSDIDTYARTKFIRKVTPEYVDFQTPSRPKMLSLWVVPHFIQYITHLDRRSFNKRIPREDAKWIGQLLSRLSPRQIRSAFEAAGYSPAEVEGFSRVIETRIDQLGEL